MSSSDNKEQKLSEYTEALKVEYDSHFINITPDGGVRKYIVEKGDGPIPKLDQEVAIHYNVTLEDGTVVGDTFESKQPLKLKVGGEASIRGVEMAIAGMRLGEKVKLEVTPEYGYGAMDNTYGFHGYGVRIPPNSKLHFELHLLAAEIAGAKTTRQWLDQAEANKNEGNKAYQEKDDEKAKNEYHLAIKILESVKKQLGHALNLEGRSEEDQVKLKNERVDNENRYKNLTVAVHSNAAAVANRVKKYDDAKLHCKAALELEPNNVKVLYRLAIAHKETDQLENAVEVLTEAKAIQDTKEIHAELTKCKSLLQDKLKREKVTYTGMFNKLKEGEGLYEGVEPFVERFWKCHWCGEEMDKIQQHRHMIKYHSGQKPPKKVTNKDLGLPDKIPVDFDPRTLPDLVKNKGKK